MLLTAYVLPLVLLAALAAWLADLIEKNARMRAFFRL